MKSLPLFYLPVSIGILVALLLSSCALTNCNDKDAPNLTDAVNGILQFQQIQLEINDSMVEILEATSEDFLGYQNATNDKFDLFQNEIIKIKQDIKSKFPQASTVETTEQTSVSSTPFLTLAMNQQEFLLGEVITFHGIATPTHAVIITLKLPDRTLEAIGVTKENIVNGQWTAEFQTKFDSPPGTWEVYARQLSDQTKTLTFKVE